MGLKKIVVADYGELSMEAARIVEKRVKEKPDLVLGLATGSTPIGLYQQLVDRYKRGEIDLARVTTFNLDEYCGLAHNHPQSYRFFMDEYLFKQVNISLNRVYFPDSKRVEEYEEKIKAAGGIDLQVLGIGRNGHIGFNEPGSSFESRTRVVDLDDTTIKDNARFFVSAQEVPRQAVTMGLATIMKAKEILLLVSGESKAEAVARLGINVPSTALPASILLSHGRSLILVDKEANGQTSKQ